MALLAMSALAGNAALAAPPRTAQFQPPLYAPNALALKVATQLQGDTDPAPASAGAGAPPSPAQALNHLYLAGDHAAVGTQALELLKGGSFNPDDALRLKIANSLAWTNRLPEAAKQYSLLIDGSEASAARLALANTYRWLARPDLSLPLYENLIDFDINNKDAKDGLDYADRELLPKTTFTLRQSSDSGEAKRATALVNHRWRDKSMLHVFEVELATNHDQLAPSNLDIRQHDATLRYEGVALPLNPRVYLNLQNKPFGGAYAGAKLRIIDPSTHLTVEHLNWGVSALSARSLDARLSANHLGLETSVNLPVGDVFARASYYRISDNNNLLTTSLRFVPAWRPLGQAFKPYVSIETRDVKFNTPDYWSPVVGSGSASLGMTAEWAEKDWFFYTAVQAGQRLYGEAGNSWSASLGAQRWVTRDVAVGVNLWGMSSVRDGARYKAHAGSIKLEKLWY